MNHLPYLPTVSESMAVIKDFSTNFLKALGLNQVYMFLKLRNNNYIVLICSFGSIKGNILQLKQKPYMFFLYLDNTDDFRLILKTIWILKTEKNYFLRIFINILDDF